MCFLLAIIIIGVVGGLGVVVGTVLGSNDINQEQAIDSNYDPE